MNMDGESSGLSMVIMSMISKTVGDDIDFLKKRLKHCICMQAFYEYVHIFIKQTNRFQSASILLFLNQ